MKRQRGFTLIESVIASAIFLVVVMSSYNAFSILMEAISSSKAKLAATSIANEKIEIIRNLPYTDVGIIAGLPAGKITRTENFIRDDYSFTVEAAIRSTDDPFDGTIDGIPSDSSPADYKLIDLDINCTNCKIFTPLKFTTLVGPHSLETASTNGALFIKVFDTSGATIPNASVHIVNTQTDPDTVIDEVTDNSGWVRIVDAPPGVNVYNISTTKSGYTEDQTYPEGGEAGDNPINQDVTVVVQEVTQADLLIDKVSSLNVSTVDSSCTSLPDIGISLTGTKIIGLPEVLKYATQNFNTGASGNYTIANLEWDTYKTLGTSPTYDLAGVDPSINFTLNPNENKNLKMTLVPHADNALLISVKNEAGTSIDGASVRLQKGIFDETKNTGGNPCVTPGQTFWNGLSSGAYTLTVTKNGYQTNVSNLNLSLQWSSTEITLVP